MFGWGWRAQSLSGGGFSLWFWLCPGCLASRLTRTGCSLLHSSAASDKRCPLFRICNIGQWNRLNWKRHRVGLVRIDLVLLGLQVHQDAVLANHIFMERPVRVQLVNDFGRPRLGVGLRVF